MHYLALCLISTSFLSSVFAIVYPSDSDNFPSPLTSRQTDPEDVYLTSVCSPNSTDPVPPCQEIINIQTACTPNGTDPIDYIAHQQCMCGGGFFSNWIGCLNCDYIHGGRSEQVVEAFNTIITSASNILCTGTPTASFADIFNSVQANPMVAPTGAATSISDQFPGNTAVSLYFTASGPSGVGKITGNATAATSVKATKTRAPSAVTTGILTASGSPTIKTAATSSSSASASSSSKAVAADFKVMRMFLGAAVGGGIMVVL